jgi:putative colanic acid biosynthesis acetyltransferase WcaF
MRFKIFVAGFANFIWNDIVTHFPVRFIRKGFLRIFNGRISPSAVILMHARILNFWNVDIGDRSVINQYVLLDCRRYKVRIENDVDIGPYTRVWTLGHSPESPTHDTVGGEVVISHHAWIASGVTILPAVNIGAGAVVGSASLVSKNIPALEIWAGNPARFIRKRENALGYTINYDPYFE